MTIRNLAATLATGLIVTACSSSTKHPGIASSSSRATFAAAVTNTWFPLKPGTTLVYRGTKDGQASRDVVTVLKRTVVVDGAPCVLVSDRLYLSGKLEERTIDFYSQDQDGNVWYFGEETAELDAKGHVVSTEGSWRAGRDGAEPGIYIDAHPRVGRGYRQEYYRGHAEDHYEVVDLDAPVTVPYATYAHALVTKEWTRLEPGVLDHKYYAAGIGVVAEISVKGPVEINRLVSVTHG